MDIEALRERAKYPLDKIYCIREELGEYSRNDKPIDVAHLRELAAELLAIADQSERELRNCAAKR